MANLVETDIWAEGIYRIETSDPVQGGEEGIDNRQAKQLAARTQWLKKNIAALSGEEGSVTQLLQLIETVYADVGLDKGEAGFDQNWLMQALNLLIEPYAFKVDLESIGEVPIGGIIPFAGKYPPSKYLVCNGGAYSRTTYAALFAIIGTTYGAGDGLTTFNLPNYADGDAIIAGTSINVGTVTGGQFPNHVHGIGSKIINNGTGSIVDVGNSVPNNWGTTAAAGSGTKNLAAGLKTLICIRYK